MPTNVESHGIAYNFGFASTDAPTIANFTARKAALKYEPEVMEDAQNGEGLVEATTLTNAASRRISGTFTGYITAGFSANGISNGFSFVVNSVSRFFLVKSISDPRDKGKYTEVDLEVVSNILVTS